MSGVVLLTGATRGVGRTVATQLAQAGFELVLVARGEGPLRETARALGARAIPWNLTRDPDTLLTIASPVRHLVHCAGAAMEAPVAAWTPEDFRRATELFVSGPALLARAFAAQAPSGGTLIHVMQEPLPHPARLPEYAARSAGLALARSLGPALGLPCHVLVGEPDPGAAVLAILRAADQSTG